MTECNRKSLNFSSLSRRKIVSIFDGGLLTSDAGGLLLREVDRQIGLTEELAKCVADDRSQHKVVHDVRTMIRQRIFGIAMGYEDLNDQDALRSDPVMQVLAEQTPEEHKPLASPTTRGCWVTATATFCSTRSSTDCSGRAGSVLPFSTL